MIDFERKYLEAIDCISTLRETCRKEGYNEVVCFIDDFFPEIKKMADAKIAMSLDLYLDWLDGRKDYAAKDAYTIKDYRTWLFKITERTINKKDAVKPKFSVGDEISNGYEYFTITDIAGGKYWFNDRVICDISDQDGWVIREAEECDIVESLAVLLQSTPRTNDDDGSERGIGYFRGVAKDFFENVNMSYYGWRPSENQMHQLRKMITALPDGEIHVGLKSLYDDLLKLIG